MTLFLSTLGKLAFLFSFILLGFVLTKLKAVPQNADGILSKLESNLFIPCLVMGNFIREFRAEALSASWKIVAVSCCLLVITIPTGLLLSRFFAKDEHNRGVYAYGLCFANFGFMGLAVVKAIFPEFLMSYTAFVIPQWVGIYGWAIPSLLISTDQSDKSFKAAFKRIANPIFVCMAIGAVIGVTGLWRYIENSVVMEVITTSGNCMSPIAMLLTGISIAKIDILRVIKKPGIYVASVLRLVVIPLSIAAVLTLFKLDKSIVFCALCAFSMPLGLNSVVIPARYGKDTSLASGMAVVSHALSIITLPIIFSIFS